MEFRYRIHKNVPPGSILNHINLVHASSQFLEAHFNIILLSTPRPSGFFQISPPKPSVHVSSPPKCHMSLTSPSSRPDHPDTLNIRSAVQTVKLLVMRSLFWVPRVTTSLLVQNWRLMSADLITLHHNNYNVRVLKSRMNTSIPS